jgi:hypothetical protein
MIRKKKKMTAAILLKRTEKVRVRNINGEKMVILPFETWEGIEDYFEEVAMGQSPRLIAKIKKARAEKRSYSLKEVKKRLGL